MATRQTQAIAKWALAPSVGILSGFAFIPLALVFYYAFLRYNLQDLMRCAGSAGTISTTS